MENRGGFLNRHHPASNSVERCLDWPKVSPRRGLLDEANFSHFQIILLDNDVPSAESDRDQTSVLTDI
jgi:hypothetical protein